MPRAVPASDEDQTYRLGERDLSLVLQWRFDSLLGLGVDATDAALLVVLRDVHHQVEALTRAGCPPGVAVRIVQ